MNHTNGRVLNQIHIVQLFTVHLSATVIYSDEQEILMKQFCKQMLIDSLWKLLLIITHYESYTGEARYQVGPLDTYKTSQVHVHYMYSTIKGFSKCNSHCLPRNP